MKWSIVSGDNHYCCKNKFYQITYMNICSLFYWCLAPSVNIMGRCATKSVNSYVCMCVRPSEKSCNTLTLTNTHRTDIQYLNIWNCWANPISWALLSTAPNVVCIYRRQTTLSIHWHFFSTNRASEKERNRDRVRDSETF